MYTYLKMYINSVCQVGEVLVDDARFRAVLVFIIILACLYILQILTRIKFKNRQLEYPRVSQAMEEKGDIISKLFVEKGFKYPPDNILIRAFKEEKILELWACAKKRGPYVLIKAYDISCSSGNLGPKRREGDMQVPEGFYYIDRFNPASKFYLSLSISYPNESDCILGLRENLGGDIFIHGGCDTVGCIPVTDDGIKELYLIAVEAVSCGQDRIPVHIFPKKLDNKAMKELKEAYRDNESLVIFWENIKEGFDIFEKTRYLPNITVGRDGRYMFRM